jgi:hypothetical protein
MTHAPQAGLHTSHYGCSSTCMLPAPCLAITPGSLAMPSYNLLVRSADDWSSLAVDRWLRNSRCPSLFVGNIILDWQHDCPTCRPSTPGNRYLHPGEPEAPPPALATMQDTRSWEC